MSDVYVLMFHQDDTVGDGADSHPVATSSSAVTLQRHAEEDTDDVKIVWDDANVIGWIVPAGAEAAFDESVGTPSWYEITCIPVLS